MVETERLLGTTIYELTFARLLPSKFGNHVNLYSISLRQNSAGAFRRTPSSAMATRYLAPTAELLQYEQPKTLGETWASFTEHCLMLSRHQAPVFALPPSIVETPKAVSLPPSPMDEPVSPTSPPARPRGIKRQFTPDSKPVKIDQPTKRFSKPLSAEACVGANGLEAECGRDISIHTPKTLLQEPFCQVCLVELYKVRPGQPMLVNAHERPVTVPGRFCSRECYEHC